MRYLIRFYMDKSVVFSKEVFTDNLVKLMEYVKHTGSFLELKHKASYIDYEIVNISI